MIGMNSLTILFAAYLAVFLEVSFDGFRRVFGAQIDLLPVLMVYASLSAGVLTISLLAVMGGCWFDSFSANPLGITVLPLLVIGLLIHQKRELLLRDELIAQLSLGLAASAAAPLLTLVSLYGIGASPIVAWGSLWQWLVMAALGAAFTPVCFYAFARLNRAFSYPRAAESSFRPDREIKRGRQ
jgi:rod shape-determining protein MreD